MMRGLVVLFVVVLGGCSFLVGGGEREFDERCPRNVIGDPQFDGGSGGQWSPNNGAEVRVDVEASNLSICTSGEQAGGAVYRFAAELATDDYQVSLQAAVDDSTELLLYLGTSSRMVIVYPDNGDVNLVLDQVANPSLFGVTLTEETCITIDDVCVRTVGE